MTARRWSIATLGLYLLLMMGGLLAAHGDPAWFIHFGRGGNFVGLARHDFGNGVPVPLRDGADGQTFWALGRDPLLRHPDVINETFDRPVYRSQRIAYPLLASPGGLLGPEGLAVSLVLVNLIAVAAGAYAAASIAERLGGAGRASLAWGLNPAIAVAFILDTADIVAIAALLVSLWMLLDGRWRAATASAVVACLAKEIMILPILAIALVGGRRFTPRSARWMLVLTPGVAVAGWGLYERWRLGWQATSVQELTWPMHGYVDAYRRGWRPSHDWGNALVALIFLAAGVAITVAWIRRPRDLLLSAALPLAVLTPFLSGQVVGLSPNSSRALAPSVTLAALAAMLPSPQHGREEGAGPPGRPPSI